MTNANHSRISVLASLRGLMPKRHLHFSEALHVAEQQASHLLELTGTTTWPTPTGITGAVSLLRVEYRQLPSSGMSFWDGTTWVIYVDRDEPATRQRFTVMHELKHIIDHGQMDRLYLGRSRADAATEAERAADYFAACLLMPRTLMEQAWAAGHQRPAVLSLLFNVSTRAAEVRVAQLGLNEPRARCAGPYLRTQPDPSGRYRDPACSASKGDPS